MNPLEEVDQLVQAEMRYWKCSKALSWRLAEPRPDVHIITETGGIRIQIPGDLWDTVKACMGQDDARVFNEPFIQTPCPVTLDPEDALNDPYHGVD